MSAIPSRCPAPDCGEAIEYWQVNCRCGRFAGFPNYRAAVAERGELRARYVAVREGCKARGLEALLDALEALAEGSRPVIAMSFAACDDILRPGKYRNYHKRIDSGERNPATATEHSDRDMTGARLYPNYHENIHYAALSPDGRGPESYGPVAVRWEVTPTYLARRASLLEENSYTFYEHHSLGDRGATIPLGYQAIWEDRGTLAAAKIGPRLNPATGAADLADLLFRPGDARDRHVARNKDDYIEIALYADRGLDTRDVDMVRLLRPASTSEESHRRDLVREACRSRGIAFVERGHDAGG